ncbi:MAG: HDOD domain-containing protein, partial [Rhodocyclaceae bacterium]
VDPTDCYIAGLLHDFGKVVFAQCMPEEFNRALKLSASDSVPLHKAEQTIIGTDHTFVGAMLAKRWQFPDSLADCIAGHHGPKYATPLAECLLVADLVAERLG